MVGKMAPVGGPQGDHLAWMRLRGLSEATIGQRRYALARLHRSLGHDLLTATRDELEAWQRGLHLTAVGMATEVMHVAGFYRWAHDQAELIDSDPAARLIRPRKPRRVPRPMSEGNLAMALDCAPPDIRFMLVLAAFEGLRAGELARLQRSDLLDTSAPPVVVIDGKGGRQRVVPLSSRTLMEMRAYGPPSRGPAFPRRDGRPGPNTPARVSQMVNRYLHGLGIADTLHAARHGFGTSAYRVSKDLRLVQELMGHADPATTAGYVAYSSGRAVIAVEQLALHFSDSDLDVGIPPRRPTSGE